MHAGFKCIAIERGPGMDLNEQWISPPDCSQDSLCENSFFSWSKKQSRSLLLLGLDLSLALTL
jgi:hypothetical protein